MITEIIRVIFSNTRKYLLGATVLQGERNFQSNTHKYELYTLV